MNLKELLKDKMIQEIKTDKRLIFKSFRKGLADIKVAKEVIKTGNYDWVLAIAYNAMLQGGRALMFSKGYRPMGSYKHLATVKFVHIMFGKEITDRMIHIFNSMRKKRNRITYDEIDIVSEDEARSAIKFAEEFLRKVKDILNIN